MRFGLIRKVLCFVFKVNHICIINASNHINVDLMTEKLDHCARLSDKEKKQYILDETMIVEHQDPTEMKIVSQTVKPSTRAGGWGTHWQS